MCKLASVSKITDENRELAWAFMRLLGQRISINNTDGLGYAAFDKQNRIFGERWLVNHSAFRDLTEVKGVNSKNINQIYTFFGEEVKREEAQALILHARMSTCGGGHKNTHPFVDNIDNPKTVTIHNGIIYNDHQFTKKYSTCDSEVLVHLYEQFKVNEELANLSAFNSTIKGWYTVINLSTTPKGRMVMDIYTDNGRLSSYFIPELGTRVYSTSAEDILSVATFLNLTVEDRQTMAANTAMRIDVETGEEIEHIKLTVPKAKPFNNVTYMNGSLDDPDMWEQWLHGRK